MGAAHAGHEQADDQAGEQLQTGQRARSGPCWQPSQRVGLPQQLLQALQQGAAPFPFVTYLTGMWSISGQTFDGGMFAECVSCAEHAMV